MALPKLTGVRKPKKLASHMPKGPGTKSVKARKPKGMKMGMGQAKGY